MKNFEIKFSLLKNLVLSLLLGLSIIMMVSLLIVSFIYETKHYAVNIMVSIMLVMISGTIFYPIRRALYRKAVMSINEKGVQLTYFCDVFIPWKDIEKVKLISGSWGNSTKPFILIIMLKDNDIYVNQYIKGMSKSAMQRNIRKHLSPIAIDASQFETSIESIQELLEKGLQEYKAKAATV